MWDHRPMPAPALLERISIDPAICGGRPCVRGHRIWVALVLGMLAGGVSVDEILAEYPGLQEADVRTCIAYGAKLAGARYVEPTPAG